MNRRPLDRSWLAVGRRPLQASAWGPRPSAFVRYDSGCSQVSTVARRPQPQQYCDVEPKVIGERVDFAPLDQNILGWASNGG